MICDLQESFAYRHGKIGQNPRHFVSQHLLMVQNSSVYTFQKVDAIQNMYSDIFVCTPVIYFWSQSRSILN